MDFPIPKLDRMPVRISPCPILESVLEVRYVTGKDWSLLPGLLYSQLKERYPQYENLPVSHLPDEFLKNDPGVVYAPRVRYLGESFIVQFGPRVVSLMFRGDYPGWQRIAKELSWLLERLKKADFIHEGERLGMRYIDFFPEDIFAKLLDALSHLVFSDVIQTGWQPNK